MLLSSGTAIFPLNQHRTLIGAGSAFWYPWKFHFAPQKTESYSINLWRVIFQLTEPLNAYKLSVWVHCVASCAFIASFCIVSFSILHEVKDQTRSIQTWLAHLQVLHAVLDTLSDLMQRYFVIQPKNKMTLFYLHRAGKLTINYLFAKCFQAYIHLKFLCKMWITLID